MWTTIWAFVKKIPIAVWTTLGFILSLGLVWRYRQRVKQAEAQVEAAIKRSKIERDLADTSLAHAGDVHDIDVKHASTIAKTEAEAAHNAEIFKNSVEKIEAAPDDKLADLAKKSSVTAGDLLLKHRGAKIKPMTDDKA